MAKSRFVLVNFRSKNYFFFATFLAGAFLTTFLAAVFVAVFLVAITFFVFC